MSTLVRSNAEVDRKQKDLRVKGAKTWRGDRTREPQKKGKERKKSKDHESDDEAPTSIGYLENMDDQVDNELVEGTLMKLIDQHQKICCLLLSLFALLKHLPLRENSD